VITIAKKERWGRKYEDKRDWQVYNRELVKRGEYLLDLEVLKNWDEELKKMNEDKVGAPFRFPKSLIQIQAIWHVHQIPYRMIQGMTIDFVKIAQLPHDNHYSTANRRINKLPLDLAMPKSNTVALFADGTGFRVVEGGEYLREKYGKKNRRWVQVIILGDPVTKEPVSFDVNIIQSSEIESAKEQLIDVKKEGIVISEFGGDGGFDDLELWDWCDSENIKSVIKPDANAREDSKSALRNMVVKRRNADGYSEWQRKTRYGRRWPATEGIFSAVKVMFGEELHARSEEGLLQEAGLKFWAYQRIKRYGEA
jgi:hypothetical protein